MLNSGINKLARKQEQRQEYLTYTNFLASAEQKINVVMAEKLKKMKAHFGKTYTALIVFLVKKEFKMRMLPKSGKGKEELKLFDFHKKYTQRENISQV